MKTKEHWQSMENENPGLVYWARYGQIAIIYNHGNKTKGIFILWFLNSIFDAIMLLGQTQTSNNNLIFNEERTRFDFLINNDFINSASLIKHLIVANLILIVFCNFAIFLFFFYIISDRSNFSHLISLILETNISKVFLSERLQKGL